MSIDLKVSRGRIGTFAAFALLASCQAVPPPRPALTPAPAPVPAPAPPPGLDVPQSSLGWEEAPVAPGNWSYAKNGDDSVASFAQSATLRALTLRCRKASGSIELSIAGAAAPGIAAISTNFGTLRWQAVLPAAPGMSGQVSVTRPASDVGFDWIAYSRGRFAIEVNGGQRLVVPVWAEIGRVVEDCRN